MSKIQFRTQYPGQQPQLVDMPEHMLRNIVKLGRLPPFVDVFVPLGPAMSRNMSAEEFEAWLVVIRANHPDWASW